MINYKYIIDSLLLKNITLQSVNHKGDYDILTIGGGANGTGNLSDYLQEVTSIVNNLKKKKCIVWLIDWINDCLDDVWTLRLGVMTENTSM